MKKRNYILALTAIATALVTAPFLINFPTKLTYNASASAPVGFYRITAASDLKRGVYTLVSTPPGFRLMAAKRRYLPLNIPLIKRVVGLSGDMICRRGQTIFVNQEPVATALLEDHRGRPMPVWQGCYVLKEDQFFALMPATDSFDGRYFGPLNKADIIGMAVPIFTRTPEVRENLYEPRTIRTGSRKMARSGRQDKRNVGVTATSPCCTSVFCAHTNFCEWAMILAKPLILFTLTSPQF